MNKDLNHKMCPDCQGMLIKWGKSPEDRIKYPDEKKILVWRCGCGYKEECGEERLITGDVFLHEWELAQPRALKEKK